MKWEVPRADTNEMRELWAGVRHLRLWLEFVAAGAVICGLSLALLRPSGHELLVAVAIGTGCLIVIGAGILVLGSETRVARLWPAVAGLGALAAMGVTTSGLGAAFGGFFTLIFVYVGLTQPTWTSVALVPLAAVGWLETNRPITHIVVARMPIAVALWIFLGELLSRFTAERDRDKRLLTEQATHDALTGLRNRHGLDRLLAEARGGDAIAFLDLDHFKVLNDSRGHEAGDHALADLGRAIRESLRADDIAVRFGGEEILVLLPSTNYADAVSVVERVRSAWSSRNADLTFSAGVAIVGPTGGVDAARRADGALYLAKERGRDRTETAANTRTRSGAATPASAVRSVKVRASGS
jgi:diguanylate cyclase (GGDEF)-like protein